MNSHSPLPQGPRHLLRLGLRGKLFVSHLLAVVLVSGSVGSFFYLSASRALFNALRARLMNTAAIVAETVDPRGLEEIGAAADATNAVYLAQLAHLRAVQAADPDIACVYIVRRSGDTITFVVDTDESENQAVPGEVYETDVPAMVEGFSRPAADEEIITDKWGASLSGYAPLRGTPGRLCLGIDMHADDVARIRHRLRFSGLVSLVCALVLALLFSSHLAEHMLAPLRLLMERCLGIAEGRIGEPIVLRTHDEFDVAIQAFNEMSRHLAEAQAHSHAAAQDLATNNELLERRVQERMREMQALNEQLTRAALTDPLTGIPNRRAALDDMRRRAESDQPFAVFIGDLDHFKRINDSFGHQVGDEALRAAAGRLRTFADKEALVARWGGEEFLVIAPAADLAAAVASAERLRAGLDREPIFTQGADLHLTISLGVAFRAPGEPVEQALRAADRALLHAKRSGRNRVELAQSSDTGPD